MPARLPGNLLGEVVPPYAITSGRILNRQWPEIWFDFFPRIRTRDRQHAFVLADEARSEFANETARGLDSGGFCVSRDWRQRRDLLLQFVFFGATQLNVLSV